MEREAVSSSNVASIGYDPESLTLEVELASGDVYQYFGVPETEYDGLRGAGYLNANIKGRYRYVRIWQRLRKSDRPRLTHVSGFVGGRTRNRLSATNERSHSQAPESLIPRPISSAQATPSPPRPTASESP